MLDEENQEALMKFKIFSMNYEDIPFGYTFSPEIKQKLNLTTKIGFVVLRNFDEGNKTMSFNELTDTSGIQMFLETFRHRFVEEFDQTLAQKIFSSQSPSIVYFSD